MIPVYQRSDAYVNERTSRSAAAAPQLRRQPNAQRLPHHTEPGQKVAQRAGPGCLPLSSCHCCRSSDRLCGTCCLPWPTLCIREQLHDGRGLAGVQHEPGPAQEWVLLRQLDPGRVRVRHRSSARHSCMPPQSRSHRCTDQPKEHLRHPSLLCSTNRATSCTLFPPLVSALCKPAPLPQPPAAVAARPAAPAAPAAPRHGPPPAVGMDGGRWADGGRGLEIGPALRHRSGPTCNSMLWLQRAARSSPPDTSPALDRTGGTQCGSSGRSLALLQSLRQALAQPLPPRDLLGWPSPALSRPQRRNSAAHLLRPAPPPRPLTSQHRRWLPRRQLTVAAAAPAVVAALRLTWCAAWPGSHRPAWTGGLVHELI